MHAGESKQLQLGRNVIALRGPLGDFHPALAISLELRRRCHSITIATTTHYRDKVEALGLDFYPMRPHSPLRRWPVSSLLCSPPSLKTIKEERK
jgi:hypothetical protein